MFTKQYIQTLLRFKKTALAIILAITVAAGNFAAQVPFDNSIEIWFLEDDPNIVAYRDFLTRFDGDQRSIIGVYSESNLFTPENLAVISELTKAARAVPFANKVESLTNIEVVQATGDDLNISPLFDELPKTPQELEKLQLQVMNNPLLYENLVSADGKATAIFVSLENGVSDFESKTAMNDALETLREKVVGTDLTLALSGAPVVDAWFDRYSKADSKTMLPLSILMIMIASFLVFRSFPAIIIPLLVVGLATIWTFGVMGVFGLKLSVISATLTAIIMAVGVADSIHVLSDFYHEKQKGHSNYEAAVASIQSLLVPCLFTSATTVAGLLSLTVSQLKPVGEFGWLAAFGVFAAFVLSVTLGPILLYYLGGKKKPTAQGPSRLTQLLLGLVRHTQPYAIPITTISALLMLLAGWGLTQLTVGANPIGYFKPDSAVRKAIETIDASLGGASEFSVLVEAPEEGFKDPDFLRRLDGVTQWMETLPGITRVLGPTDGLTEIDRVLNAPPATSLPKAKPTRGKLPDSQTLAAQYYLLLEGSDDFENTIQDDYSVGRISARGLFTEAKYFAQTLPQMEKRFAEEFPEEETNINITGYTRLMSDMEMYLLDSQIKSFLIAFLVVTLMLGILLRSSVLALFSMIPNFIPIFLGLGFMGLIKIPLDPATVMIGAIAMGLVVDDTVHFLVRLRRHFAASSDLEKAIEGATLNAGRPITVTSAVLIATFSILVFGNFTPNINFGFISAVIILLALLADLILLPAVLRLVRPKL